MPYTYRLNGPHAWSGAREAILSAPERVIKVWFRNLLFNIINTVSFAEEVFSEIIPGTFQSPSARFGPHY